MTKPWEEAYAKPWEQEYAPSGPPVVTSGPTPAMQMGVETPVGSGPRDLQSVGWGPSAAAGFVESFQKPIYGALDLAGVDVENPHRIMSVLSKARRQAALESMTELADKNIGGTVGRVIGEGNQVLLPAMATIGTSIKAGRYALPLAVEAATATARRGLITPEEGETRTGNMVEEAAINLGAGAVGAGLLKAGKGLNLARGAQEAMDSGIPLTPGMAVKSPAVRGIETAAEVTPFLARGTREFRGAADAAVSPVIIQRVASQIDDTADITRGGWQGVDELTGLVNARYDEAWDAANTAMWNNQQRERFANRLSRESARWADTQGAALSRLSGDMANPDLTLKRLDSKLRSMIQSSNDHDFTEYLKGQRARLRERAGAASNNALKDLDASYGDFLTVQRASADAPAGSAGAMTPQGLSNSVRSVSPTQTRSVGSAPLQNTADDLVRLMAREGGQPLDFFRRLANVAPTPIPRSVMDGLGQALMGQTNPQRALKEYLTANPDVARYFVTATAALGGQDN